MTRKHYILIAEELNAALEISRSEGKAAQNAAFRIIEGIATVFLRDNARFNRSRFYAACGVKTGDGL